MSTTRHEAYLVGNPTADITHAVGNNGRQYANFNLACPTWVKTQEGQWASGNPIFHRVSAFGLLAKNLDGVTTKQQLVVAGYFEHGTYTDKEGNTRQSSQFIAQHVGISVRFKTATKQSEQVVDWAAPPSDPEGLWGQPNS